jgi:hypothetical protein
MRLEGGGESLACLWVYSHNNELMFELARGYFEWATQADLLPQVFWATREFDDADYKDMQRRSEFESAALGALRRNEYEKTRKEGEPQPVMYPPRDGLAFLETPREETGAIVIRLSGEDVTLKLRLEAGAHRFRFESDSEPVNVEVAAYPIDALRAPLRIPRGMAADEPVRRRYELAQRQARDETLDQIFAWTGNRLDGVLTRCIDATFERELEKQVGL